MLDKSNNMGKKGNKETVLNLILVADEPFYAQK